MNQNLVLPEKVLFLYQLILLTGIQQVIKFRFFRRFCGGRKSYGGALVYFALLFLLGWLESGIQQPAAGAFFLMMRILLLWGTGAVFFKRSRPLTMMSAAVAETILFLVNGIVASVDFLLMEPALENPYGIFLISVLTPAVILILLLLCYMAVIKKISWQEILPERFLFIFLLPVLLILTVEQYIYSQIYGNEIVLEGTEVIRPLAAHGHLLLIQLFALASLFTTLYACRKLAGDFQNRLRIALLEQETAAQRGYVEEARLRYQQTQSFRHDIRNHLMALDGFLKAGEEEKAREYLARLDAVSEQTSFFCKTGNLVVDILLSSKLNTAKQHGIQVECTVKIPSSDALDDMDLCILFSNAVDNALNACLSQKEGERYIEISGRQKGDFFMIEIENSCLPASGYEKGTGMLNMEAVALRYQGAVKAERTGNFFRLHILLIISRRQEDITE